MANKWFWSKNSIFLLFILIKIQLYFAKNSSSFIEKCQSGKKFLRVKYRRHYAYGGEFMKKYKSKDIYEITGLSRSQVNDYSDVIIPFAYETEAYHKIYDETAMEQFKKVAICKHFKISRKEIKKYITKKTDMRTILEKQLNILELEKESDSKLIREIKKMLQNETSIF